MSQAPPRGRVGDLARPAHAAGASGPAVAFAFALDDLGRVLLRRGWLAPLARGSGRHETSRLAHRLSHWLSRPPEGRKPKTPKTLRFAGPPRTPLPGFETRPGSSGNGSTEPGLAWQCGGRASSDTAPERSKPVPTGFQLAFTLRSPMSSFSHSSCSDPGI